MRIVQFSNPDRIVNYPEEGVSAFGKTLRIGSDIVGEYSGAADAATLPDYGGQWPIVAAPTYRILITGKELMDLFDEQDPDIWLDLEGLTAPEAIEFREMVGRRSDHLIRLDHPKMIAALDKMELAGIATPDQIAIVKLGVRL